MTWVIVCMGVSATGKTSVARELADRLSVSFEEGDHHHPQANIDKMEHGVALTDEDRRPWLDELGRIAADAVADGRSLVMTCSALKRSYRDRLRSHVRDDRLFFVHLHAPYAVLADRMALRTKHFMPTSLLDDQFATLEPLGDDENGAAIDVSPPLEQVVDAAQAAVAPLVEAL